MNKRSLKSEIAKKLDQLSKLIDEIDDAHVINSDDPETWDSDALYNLVENCKKVIKLLEDKVIPGKYDEFGQPLTENGLCFLVDSYQEEANFDDEE